jgi:hypothetical protein
MNIDKLLAKRSVLERTKKQDNLPNLALYTQWLGGTGQRRLIDIEQGEHIVDDKTVKSCFRMLTGSQSKALIKEHWPSFVKSKKPS